MPPEIIALIDKPWLLLTVLAVGAVCGMLVERLVERGNRAKRRAYWEKRNGNRSVKSGGRFGSEIAAIGKAPTARGSPEATTQLQHVMDADFRRRALLNKPERRILAGLDRVLADDAPAGWRAMGQVSLGEIVSSPSEEAYFAVNAKRVDLLVVDGECVPLFTIEYQGEGHHQGTAAARDAVKREALRKAGIDYEEIRSGDTLAELRGIVRKQVRKRSGKSAA